MIGRGGRLPWRIPEDWQYFRRTTTAATVVLGRISFESWRSVLDDERYAVVLTRNHSLASERVQTARSLEDALRLASAEARPIFVCGGQRIFEEAIARPEAERLYLTRVHAQIEGDRTFPDWRSVFTRTVSYRDSADENFRYTFSVLER